tara:strand:- start:181 stop:621 length:441 start_codon:yes stop_codon:yes gene_type:complete
MYSKKSGRVTFKSNRRPGFKRNNNYSHSKGRNKGNLSQQYNKYLKLAKEAFTSGDRVQSEYYYQFTDHYYRLMVDLGMSIEDNNSSGESKIEEANINENVTNSEDSNETKKTEDSDDSLSEETSESIESIPFIAEPAKKKKVRTTE